MHSTYLSDNSFLFRLTKRFTLFLLLQSAVLVLLYTAGNFQNFLDSTLRFILLFGSVTSIMLAFFAFAGMAESFFLIFITKKGRYAAYFFFFLLLLCMDGAVFLILRGIVFLSSGLQLPEQ